MATVLPIRPPCDSNPATPGAQSLKDVIEEVSNDGSQPKRRRMGSGDSSRSCDTFNQELGPTYFPAENLTEYKWPADETGEYYMLQEQVSEYLGVTSFKRKYPGEAERILVCCRGAIVDEVIDLMIKEYPTKHSEYSVILQERERQRIAKEYSQMQQQNPQKVEASKVPEYIKEAAKKAAEFNSNFNRERMEERRAYFDLQTHIIQVPQGRFKVLAPELTRTGPYPVALIPGQFQDYYKRYSPNELRYLPLNTALFEPPLDPELPALDSEPDSDDAEDGKDVKKNKNSSDSSSGNTSDMESQEGGGGGHKSKVKDRTSMPGKDQRHSSSYKATPGYKVEDKTT
uniref:PHD finger protein 10 n=1 Tax=Nothobranchius furzeri TaxID=105023 RepID=A0A8C6L262_NOTFU